jgi:hypothetical protein
VGFYDEMQDMASELLGELGQGVVSLKRISRADGPNAWTPGAETVETFALSGAVRRLHQRYEGGVLIVETGDMVTFAVPEVVPVITDLLVIDGVERAITNLTPVPGAGVTAAWKAWCAA